MQIVNQNLFALLDTLFISFCQRLFESFADLAHRKKLNNGGRVHAASTALSSGDEITYFITRINISLASGCQRACYICGVGFEGRDPTIGEAVLGVGDSLELVNHRWVFNIQYL